MPKVALVTGGARRIGREIAIRLHEAGFDIALHYRNSGEDAEAVADNLNALRAGSCALFQADLSQIDGAQTLGKEVLTSYESLDLLVNNASGFEATPIESCTEQDFDDMLGANLKGPYFLIQSLLCGLRASGGNIVNILDIHAEYPLKNYNAYCAAKAGLASLTRSLAVELGPDIRVNGVSPGAILWPEGESGYDADLQAHTIASTPLQRLGDPADIAKTVKFLACDAPFITGQVISVDGGKTLAG